MIKAKALAQSILAFAKENQSLSEQEIADKIILFAKNQKIERLLPSVIDFLERLAREETNKDKVTIRTAQPLSKDLIAYILSQAGIGDKNAEISIEDDKTLLAGSVVEFKGTRFDASAKTKLERLKQHLVTN